ncbi:hypothetical protein [Kibdelosporangium aridum]|uniref:hypothetical protein n=1 Tax=Kibdelosporangium aridum TaxID=2030 RepID=UPI000525FA01
MAESLSRQDAVAVATLRDGYAHREVSMPATVGSRWQREVDAVHCEVNDAGTAPSPFRHSEISVPAP